MSVVPKIYVISLAVAQERHDFMRRQLQALNLPYDFFEAIHGVHDPDFYLFQRYNDEKRLRLRGTGTSLKLGQLGCYASHYLLWEKCVALGEPIIVLEDDAILQPNFVHFIENAALFAARYGLVWLQPSRKIAHQAGYPLGQIGPFTVKKFTKGFAGTTGYLITPQAAQTLLAYSAEWLYPVDNTMDRFYDHKVEAIGIDPTCLQQDDDLGSFINTTDPSTKRAWQDSLRREWASGKDNLKRMTHNVLFRIKNR